MAPFHQCPWENCNHAHEEVSVGTVSSPEDIFKLGNLEDLTDSSSFPALSQKGCSEAVSIPEIVADFPQGPSTKATPAIAILHPSSDKEKKPNTRCVHESPGYRWKSVDKRGQKCDVCFDVLPLFVLRCTRCNVQVCKMCASRKGWMLRRIAKNPLRNL